MTNKQREFLLLTQTTNLFTLGKLYEVKGNIQNFIAYSLESPWKNNKPNISCIPQGDYLIKPLISPEFGTSYYFESILGGIVDLTNAVRTKCLIRSGNFASELCGHVSFGGAVGILANKENKPEFSLLDSRKTTNSFIADLDAYDYKFKIIRR